MASPFIFCPSDRKGTIMTEADKSMEANKNAYKDVAIRCASLATGIGAEWVAIDILTSFKPCAFKTLSLIGTMGIGFTVGIKITRTMEKELHAIFD